MRTLDEIRVAYPDVAASTPERWLPAKLFMSGKLSADEYKAYEPSYQTNYVAVMTALARKAVEQKHEQSYGGTGQ